MQHIDVFRDVTHEKEIDKAKSEFVSLASHQLRTPLGIVKWYLEALKTEQYLSQAPENIRDLFDQIYKSNERVLSLVRDLLSVSRIDQGKVKNIPKLVNLSGTIKETMCLMHVLADNKKVKLRFHDKNNFVPKIKLDAVRFGEVIENLIGNAIEYNKKSGSVDISLSSEGQEIFISVKDTGIGMSSSDQTSIFTKFFRSEAAIKQNPEGSGLGLYVVKSYVEGWGGKIEVKSTLGKGTEFIISLPISQEN